MSLTGINPYDPIDIWTNFGFAALSSIPLLLLRRGKKNFTLVTHLFLIITLLISIVALVFITDDSFRAIWFFVVVYLAYSFEGTRAGIFYTILSMGFILAYEVMAGHPTALITVNTTIIGLGVMSFLFYVNTRKFFEQTEALQEKSRLLTQLASIDSLTGISNRYHFDEEAPLCFERASRQKGNLSLILLDIDHFKQINDTYGHIAGNHVLVEFAHTIQDFVGDGMIFARTGGEEFALLLCDSSFDEATTLSETIRQAISSNTFDIGEQKISITVSIGVADYREADRHFSDLFLRADLALYQAKEEGRNRVVSAI